MLMAILTSWCTSQKPQSGGNVHVTPVSSGFIDPSTDSQDWSNNTRPKTTYIEGNSQDCLSLASFHTFLTFFFFFKETKKARWWSEPKFDPRRPSPSSGI